MRRHGGKARALDNPQLAQSYPIRRDSVMASPTSPLNQDMDQLALSYCYHMHVIRPGPMNVRDEKVLASMKALGMASYSNMVNSSSLRDEASSYYLSALQIVNTALRSPTEIMQDSTLLAIITLSCFESISGGSLKRSLEGWSAHIQGMAALVEQRGIRQMQTVAGRMFFLQACTLIVGDCLRSGLPVPQSIHGLVAFVTQHDPRWRVLPALMRVADLKAAVIHRAITDPDEIIARARALDCEFSTAYSIVVPPGFEYTTLAHRTWAGSELPAYLYIYRSTTGGMMWNTMRNGRLLCHGMIIDILKRKAAAGLDPDDSLDEQESRRVIRRAQMDILASMPQDLRTTGAQMTSTANTIAGGTVFKNDDLVDVTASQLPNLTAPDLPTLHISRGHTQVFVLALVGRLASPGSEIRGAVCRLLDMIGKARGFPLAFVFGTALKENRISSSVIDYHSNADAWILGDDASDSYTVGRRFKK